MVKPIPNTPITPEQLLTNWPDDEDAMIGELVEIVNAILCSRESMILFKHHKSVDIYDSGHWEMWKLLHEKVIDRFKDAGWHVEHGDSTEYKFYLPEIEHR